MKVNGKMIEEYGGTFVSFVDSPSTLSSNIILNGLHQIDNGPDITPSLRELTVVFDDVSSQSNFYAELLKGTVIEANDGFLYKCIVVITPVYDHKGSDLYESVFTLSCVRYGKLETVDISTFIVNGNYKTGARYLITATGTTEGLKIDGIEVPGTILSGKTLIIDGIDYLVYYSDAPNQSVVDNVLFSSFPYLEPGNHVVNCNKDTVTVQIQYYPIYV